MVENNKRKKAVRQQKLVKDKLEYEQFLSSCWYINQLRIYGKITRGVQWDDEYTSREIILMSTCDINQGLRFLLNCKTEMEVIEQAVSHWDEMITFYKYAHYRYHNVSSQNKLA
jgi:hypothetical protein